MCEAVRTVEAVDRRLWVYSAVAAFMVGMLVSAVFLTWLAPELCAVPEREDQQPQMVAPLDENR